MILIFIFGILRSWMTLTLFFQAMLDVGVEGNNSKRRARFLTEHSSANIVLNENKKIEKSNF